MENIYFDEIKNIYGKYGVVENVPLQTNLNKGCLIKNLQSGTFTNKTVVNAKAYSTANKLKKY